MYKYKSRRLAKLESKEQEKRTAVFIVSRGKASGSAWWSEKLRWEDLSKPEFETLKQELEADGVEVIEINLVPVFPDGRRVDSWEEGDSETET